MYLLLAGKTEIGGELSCVRFCAGILVVINKQSADRLQTPPPPMSELGLTIAIFNKKVSQVGFDLIAYKGRPECLFLGEKKIIYEK